MGSTSVGSGCRYTEAEVLSETNRTSRGWNSPPSLCRTVLLSWLPPQQPSFVSAPRLTREAFRQDTSASGTVRQFASWLQGPLEGMYAHSVSHARARDSSTQPLMLPTTYGPLHVHLTAQPPCCHVSNGRLQYSSSRPPEPSPNRSEDSSLGSSSASQKLLGAGPETSAGRPAHQFRSGPVTWGSLALLLLTGGGLLWYFEREKGRRLDSLRKVRSVGKAAIGGHISLLDQDGKGITEENLKGQWNLLYFGFTFCPDICPAELEKMASAIDILEKKHGVLVQPVFISVDPERDTVEQVKAYVKEFHPKLIGLTGPVQNVQEAAHAFRVYYMKTEEEGDDYLVDHSIIMYLMDPNWEFVKFFGRNHSPESLADGIGQEITTWPTQNMS